MPRYKLIQALEKAEISQSGLAALIWAERKAVNRWLRGEAEPRMEYREPIRRALKNNDDPDLFKNYPEGQYPDSVSHAANNCPQVQTSQQLPPPCQTMENHDIVNSADPPAFVIHIPRSVRGFGEFMDIVRRQFIEVVAQLGLTASLGHLSLGLVSSPHVDPEEYLALCNASIGTWWEWFNQGKFSKVDEVLRANVPILKRLANTFSPFQGTAASLAAQAKFMQMLLETRRYNFVAREIVCAEAVQLGRLSGNRDTLALALVWQGNTYIICYHQPQTAIPILHDALSYLDDALSSTRSAIYSNLSIAYAEEGDEAEARKHAELAHMVMPEYPEFDPLHNCIRWNHAALSDVIGTAHLHLAGHFPDSDYAELAYNAFDEAVNKPAISQSTLGGALTHKADAARLLGDMKGSVECLVQGLPIAIEFENKRCIFEIGDIVGRMQPEWKREIAVQNLQKDISNAIVVARR